MSKEILINIEEFQSALSSINSIVGNMESIKNDITSTNDNLKGQWEGKSSKAFFKESENIANTFTDYVEGLTMLYQDLGNVLTTFVEADNQIAEVVMGGD